MRRLGLWASVGIVMGITIGSGIFRTPASIASLVPSPLLMLCVWVVGGVIALCGALSIAELSAALPQTGGMYVFIRDGWGRMAAFLFGWSQVVLIRAASASSIATVFGEYLIRSLGLDPRLHPIATDCASVGAIAVAVIANIRGVQFGALMIGLSTVAKASALGGLVLLAWLFGAAHGASAEHFVQNTGAAVTFGSFGLALVAVLWVYDGFADVAFVAGEVREPGRNLPRALGLGTLAIVAIYLLVNAAFLYLFPVGDLAKSPLIAADAMRLLFGEFGASFVSIIVLISTFGGLNGSMLVVPRIYFALAEDGLFFRAVAKVHPRYHTPYVAILMTATFGAIFAVAGTFERLTDTFVKAMLPFYGLSVAAVYRLRKSQPDLVRPYRVTGYPLVPIGFIIGVVLLMVNSLVTDTLATSLVFATILAGIPVYYVLFARRGPDSTAARR